MSWVHATTRPGGSAARVCKASTSARDLCIVRTLCTTTRSARATCGRRARVRRWTRAACSAVTDPRASDLRSRSTAGWGDETSGTRARRTPRGAARPRAAITVTSPPASRRRAAVEPGGQRRVHHEAPVPEVRPQPEKRPQAQEDHARGPCLRDARHEVVGRTRREPQVALEAAEELGEARVREALARLEQPFDDRRRPLAHAVASEALRDERAVVRPDRTVVVAHRVVRRIAARERADAPGRDHVRPPQPG